MRTFFSLLVIIRFSAWPEDHTRGDAIYRLARATPRVAPTNGRRSLAEFILERSEGPIRRHRPVNTYISSVSLRLDDVGVI
jgi:hypothetical protein